MSLNEIIHIVFYIAVAVVLALAIAALYRDHEFSTQTQDEDDYERLRRAAEDYELFRQRHGQEY